MENKMGNKIEKKMDDMMENKMRVEFAARSVNEGFARVTAAAFLAQLNPTVDEVEDVRTAVSEAVTNAIIHGYENNGTGTVGMTCVLHNDSITVEGEDSGKGITDIRQAMEPFFTTKPELERSGMGFAFMEAFMDEMHVESVPGKGTKVVMKKKIGQRENKWNECGDNAD